MIKRTLIEKQLIDEKNINIDFDMEIDVAVIGLGTAGALAINSAAKQGLSTLGVEKNNYMGGVGTGGGIHIYYFGSTGGLQNSIDKMVMEQSREFGEKSARGFHPEAKKMVVERECKKNGSQIYYQSVVIGVYLEGEKVVGFELKTPESILNIRSKFVIDCSGDGDFCILAGCDYQYGREVDHSAQPFSAPRSFVSKDLQVNGANFDAGYVDTTDGQDFSNAIMKAHCMHLKDQYDENDRYILLSPHLGIREGRFIRCEEEVTFAGLIENKTFEKPVMELYAHHDNHSKDWAFENDLAQDWVVVCGLWRREITGQMPMGALIPKGKDGLLVAGRCAGMDHDASQTFRMQRDMQKLGEIAAHMSKVAIEENCAIREIPYEKLITHLTEEGLFPKKWLVKCEPLASEEEVINELKLESPGFGIWSCVKNPEKYLPLLLEGLQQNEEESFQKACAFALGLIGDERSKPLLLKMVNEKDAGVFKVPYACPFYGAAMYLLSKMGEASIADQCKEYLETWSDQNFHAISFPFTALLRLANSGKIPKESTLAFLKDFLTHKVTSIPLLMQVSNTGKQAIEERHPLFLKAIS